MNKFKLLQTIQKAIKTKAFIAIISGVVVVGGISTYAISQNKKSAEAANTKNYVSLDTTKEADKEADKSKVEEKKVEEVKPTEQPKTEEKKEDTIKVDSDSKQTTSSTTSTNSTASTNSSTKSNSNNTTSTPKPSTPAPAPAPKPTPAPAPQPTPAPTGAQPPSGYNGEAKMYNASLSQQVDGKLGLNRNTAFYSALHPETLKTALADDPNAFLRDGNIGVDHFLSYLENIDNRMYLYMLNGKKYASCRYYADWFNINSNDVSVISQAMKTKGLLNIENILGTELDQTYFETFVIWDNNSKTNKVVRIYMTFVQR